MDKLNRLFPVKIGSYWFAMAQNHKGIYEWGKYRSKKKAMARVNSIAEVVHGEVFDYDPRSES
jgi:hypothetical protein